METTISATEANRSFAKALRRLRAGERVRITSHGEVVAIIVPPAADNEAERHRREEAVEALERRWATQPPVAVGPWTREELHERASWDKWRR